MTVAHFSALFGFGCAATSLIAWLAASHPALYGAGLSFFLVGAIFWFACFFLDDLFSPHVGLNTRDYHALMIAIALAAVIGVGMVCLAPSL